MDPDVALKQIRHTCNEIDKCENPDEAAQLAETLATLVQGLDHWISKGGYLPKEWRRENPGPAQ
jgi:hypothetical protein